MSWLKTNSNSLLNKFGKTEIDFKMWRETSDETETFLHIGYFETCIAPISHSADLAFYGIA
ncbi:MAG: hypothetical protein EOO88_36280 [Pedobacter sp.]|nr:MAG: hypothetical protein EOO88_36280 [Pedobacter sp.]